MYEGRTKFAVRNSPPDIFCLLNFSANPTEIKWQKYTSCGFCFTKNLKIESPVVYKVKLKNADDTVLLDSATYEWMISDPYLSKIDFLNNLRKHSSGCAVFQKTWRKADGDYKTETIYLHKIIAERFLVDQKRDNKSLVGAKNGDKLDCRVDNLIYRSRAVASRQRKTSSKTGFTGVYQEHNRYRAVISVHGKPVHLGMFDTAEEAALAYNKMSKEMYGEDGKLNRMKGS